MDVKNEKFTSLNIQIDKYEIQRSSLQYNKDDWDSKPS